MSAAPASPACSTFTLMPVCFVNAREHRLRHRERVVGDERDRRSRRRPRRRTRRSAATSGVRDGDEQQCERGVSRACISGSVGSRGATGRCGLHGEQHAAGRARRVASRRDELVAHAAGRAGMQRLAVQREAQARRCATPCGGPADREQRDRARPASPCELDARRARRATRGVADARLDRAASAKSSATRAGARWRGSGRAARRAPPTTTTRVGAASRAARERELEVGGVLRRRVALDRRRPPRSAASSAAGSTESRSPTTRSTRRPSALRVVEARVGGDHEIATSARSRSAALGGRWIAAGEHQRDRADDAPWSHDSLRRHYPVQVRGVGDARDGRPLSPAVPSSPGIRLCGRTLAVPRQRTRSRLRRMTGVADDVVLVRHGETEWSSSGRHTSFTDIPLTGARPRAGRRGARTVSRRRSFALVLTSPRQRARDTCALAGLGAHAVGRRRPRGVGLRRVRGPHDRRDPRAAIPAGRSSPAIRPAARPPTQVGARADRVLARAVAADGAGRAVLARPLPPRARRALDRARRRRRPRCSASTPRRSACSGTSATSACSGCGTSAADG